MAENIPDPRFRELELAGYIWADYIPTEEESELTPRVGPHNYRQFVIQAIRKHLPVRAQLAMEFYSKRGVADLWAYLPITSQGTSKMEQLDHFHHLLMNFVISPEFSVTEFEQYMQDHSPDLNFVSPFCEMTVLHHAVLVQNYKAVQWLLTHGADSQQSNVFSVELPERVGDIKTSGKLFGGGECGITPFWIAVALGYDTIVKRCLETEEEDFRKPLPKQQRMMNFNKSALIAVNGDVFTPYHLHNSLAPEWQAELVIDPRDRFYMAFSPWHFTSFRVPDVSQTMFTLLHGYMPLPVQDAVYLVAAGPDEKITKQVVDLIATQPHDFPLVEPEPTEDSTYAKRVIWTFGALHHETLYYLNLNDPQLTDNAPWNLVGGAERSQDGGFKMEELMYLLALPAYGRLQRQAQLLFLQHALAVIVGCNPRLLLSPFDRHEQNYLVCLLIRLGARIEGMDLGHLQCARFLITRQCLMEDPLRIRPINMFNSGHQILCNLQMQPFEKNLLNYNLIVLRQTAQPLPDKVYREFCPTGPTYWETEAEVQQENMMLHMLSADAIGDSEWRFNTDPVLIPTDPYTGVLHDPRMCEPGQEEHDQVNYRSECVPLAVLRAQDPLIAFAPDGKYSPRAKYLQALEIRCNLRSQESFDQLFESLDAIGLLKLQDAVWYGAAPGYIADRSIWTHHLPHIMAGYQNDSLVPHPIYADDAILEHHKFGEL